jgi:transglutaminase-like putative cysteine protease
VKKLFIYIQVFIAASVNAQSYNSLLIPDSLSKNANVVCRYNELRIEIKEPGKAKIYRKNANTILNEAGNRYSFFYTQYDKFNDINDIDGTLFDAMGKELKNVKKKDIEDLSGNDDMSLMVDTRFKVHSFYYRSYPYTVEYEEEKMLNGVFDLPDWYPQQSNTMSVQYGKLVVVAPKDLDIRYKQFNYPGNPVITEEKGLKVYTWELKNQTAKVSEQYQPSWREILPSVLVAPTSFEIQGYKGEMSSWENFGMFINSLLKGKDVMPEAIKQKVHELTNGITDKKEKVKVLYNFLQQNTRYISVQLGIGGWQPFDANYVYIKRYGDCKALSNYMVALLKEAGINANYVLIRAGDDAEDIITDFPSNQFNHATVCVPINKDTMWLECTSQTVSAGYQGDFTGNRHALLIDDKGGHVISTTVYRAEDNVQLRSITSTIDETGKLTANINTHYACLQQDNLQGKINHLSKDKLLESLKKDIDLPDYDVTSFNYEEKKSEKPAIDEHLLVVANNYASVSGKRMFIMPDILNRNTVKFKTEDQRKYDIEYAYSFTDKDTVAIKIPTGYNIESMPKDVTINNKFGDYEIHFKVEDNNITCTRLFKQSKARFPATDYPELVKYYETIYKADRSRIVFIKKEG